MLLAVKSFEIFSKRNGYGFISEYFAVKWYIFEALTDEKLFLPLWWSLKINLFPDFVKLMKNFASDVNEYHLILLLYLHQELRFFLLSVCTYELLSTPKVIMFLT